MAHKIYHDISAACTDAYALIAEGWNALVQDGLTPDLRGVPPVDDKTQVIWAASPEGDVCGVLCFAYETQAQAISIKLAYVEPSMRKRGVFKDMIAHMQQLGQKAQAEVLTITAAPADAAVAKLFGSPVSVNYEIRLG